MAHCVLFWNGYHPGVNTDLVPKLIGLSLIIIRVRCVRFESDRNVAG